MDSPGATWFLALLRLKIGQDQEMSVPGSAIRRAGEAGRMETQSLARATLSSSLILG